MSKSTFVLVPGGSCLPTVYDDVAKGLQASGYPTLQLALPSMATTTYDFTEDVAEIRSTVTKLVEEEKDVIVVLHSYAGIPGGEALEGLGKLEREKKGLKGGVARLVFIVSWAMAEGTTGAGERGDCSQFPPYMVIDVKVSKPQYSK
jgi:hypothetical protein